MLILLCSPSPSFVSPLDFFSAFTFTPPSRSFVADKKINNFSNAFPWKSSKRLLSIGSIYFALVNILAFIYPHLQFKLQPKKFMNWALKISGFHSSSSICMYIRNEWMENFLFILSTAEFSLVDYFLSLKFK